MSLNVSLLKKVQENDDTLTDLDLWGNRIGAAGAKDLAAAFKVNKSLANLNLGSNDIGATGAKDLAAALSVNKSLAKLILVQNDIGAAGAKDLAAALSVNKGLANLNLGYNNIGDAGAKDLASALKVNKSLANLCLLGNRIGDAGAKDLAAALKVNNSLANLCLGYNRIGAAGAKDLAAALKANKSVTNLDLSGNHISDAGIEYLCDGLANNFTLLKLHGISNPTIQGYLARNKMLAELFEDVTRTFSNKLSELIDGETVQDYLNELTTFSNLNLVLIDNSLFPKEFHRLLMGLRHLSNYQANNQMSSLDDAFQCLTPAFKNAQLQPLVDEALLASINALYASCAEEQDPNRKTELHQNLLYTLRPYLKCLDIQLIAYDAFAQLEKKSTSISPLDISQYQETLALLNYEEALAITEEALNISQGSEEQNIHEKTLLTELLRQREYQPLVIHYLFKSPTFVATFQKHYTQEDCFFVDDCFFSTEKNEFAWQSSLKKSQKTC